MASFSARVIGGGLNLRSSCSTQSYSPVQIPNHTSITVETVPNEPGWFATSYYGHNGFVLAEFVFVTNGNGTCKVSTSSDPLNIRRTPSTSANILYGAPRNSTLQLLDTTVSGWYRVSSEEGTGWGSSSYLTILTSPDEDDEGDSNENDNASGDSGSNLTGTETYGTISCNDYVNIRATYSTSGEILGRLFDGDPVVYYAGQTYSGSGHTWYRIRFDGVAYIAAEYIVANNDNHTVVRTLSYDNEKAVEYASNHTKTVDDYTQTNYHTGFGFNEHDCANFVNQCLCAGGLPMFKGWSDNISGIPSSWSNDNWQLTNASRCPLIVKGRISKVNCNQVKKGDIIYRYDTDPDTNDHLRHYHVFIAATDYSSSIGGCYIHGHTENERYVKKTLNDTYFRCYHVNPDIYVEACEKRVSLPVSGNSYEVLN